MSIDIKKLIFQLDHELDHSRYKFTDDFIINMSKIYKLKKALEQQQKEIEARDEVIRGMIDEYGHHIGFDVTGEFIKSKRKTFALDKAREILNIKGDSDD